MSVDWLKSQRSTPSFSSPTGGERLNNVLDQPLPAALRGFGDGPASPRGAQNSSVGSIGSMLSPVGGAQSLLGLSASSARTPRRSVSAHSRRSRSGGSARARTPPPTTHGSRGGKDSSPQRSVQRGAMSGDGAYLSSIVDQHGQRKAITVFESLVERGRMSRHQQEKAREKARVEELQRCRSVPKVSKMAHQINRDRSIFERLATLQQEKKRTEEFQRQARQIAENKLYDGLFQPRISHKGHRSKGTAGTAMSTEKYSYKTLQRMDDIRKEKVMREMEMVMEQPDINAKSAAMAMRRREREGMAGYSHIEAMIERDRLAKLSRFEQHERSVMEQCPGTPRITEYAATLDRGDEDVAERLYRKSINPLLRSTTSAGGGDGAADGGSHRPRPRSAGPSMGARSNADLLSSLAKHDEDLRRRRDERIRKVMEEGASTHKPTINPVSAAIADRLPTSTADRLLHTPRSTAAGTSSISTRGLAAGGESEDSPPEDLSGRAPATPRDVQLFERLKIAEARRRVRIEAARREQEQRRMQDCTFSPITTTSYFPPQQAMPSPSGGGGGPNSSIYERNQEWQRQRQDRLRAARTETAKEALADCSFQPAVSHVTNEMFEAGTSYESTVHAGATPHGFDGFVQRQARAREQAGELAAATALGNVNRPPMLTQSQPWNGSTAVAAAAAARGNQPQEHQPFASFERQRNASEPATVMVASTRRPVEAPNTVVSSAHRSRPHHSASAGYGGDNDDGHNADSPSFQNWQRQHGTTPETASRYAPNAGDAERIRDDFFGSPQR